MTVSWNYGLWSSRFCCPLGSKSWRAQGLLPDALRSWREGIILPQCLSISTGDDHIVQDSVWLQKPNPELSSSTTALCVHKTSSTSLIWKQKYQWPNILTFCICYATQKQLDTYITTVQVFHGERHKEKKSHTVSLTEFCLCKKKKKKNPR